MVTKSAKRVASFLGTSALTRPLFALGAASALLGAGQAQALDANTLPQNPNVVGGKDSFAQSGNTLNVNQSTKRTVIDWRSFDIGSKAQVNFNQPGTSAIAVNRVNSSANATQIEGGLHANGQVWILNPNGVFFGKGAHVDAAGIVASTANIDTNAFMAGSNKLQMTGADHGSVENQGNISVGANGLAAFVAPSVRNSGVINATVGKVALAAGTTYTLDLAGDHLVELGLGSVKAVVDNSGRIVNPGGTIALTAKAAGQVVSSVVNVSGVVSASSVSKSGGTITLGGDNINTTATAQLSADAGTNGNGGAITSVANNQGNYAGSFSAKGGSASGNGGKVETSGTNVHIDPAAKINASATNGMAGTWLLDPLNVTITNTGSDDGLLSGATVQTATIQDMLAGGTSVDITTSQGGNEDGDLTLAASINATSTGNAGLTLEGRHLSATNGSTIGINGGALTLNVNAVNPLADTTGGNWVQDAVNMIGTVTGGSTVHLGAGIYAGGTQIHASNVTLTGDTGAKIVALTNGVDGVEIFGNNVTVQNLEFAGPANQSFTTFAWGNDITRGIFVENGAQNFNITGNNIHGLRNDILVDGRNTGSITNNTIDNSKSGISVQYTDGTAYDKSLDSSNSPVINIAGNVQGAYGNEWGINYHLNGYWNGVAGDETHPNANPVTNGIYLANAPTLTWQQGMLAQSAANGGMSIQDQAYKTSNRTSVTVSTTGSDTHQGSVLSTLGTIQGGINAVVTGGTVNVLDGTYVIPSGGANYIEIQKALTLKGQSELGTIIDARNASTYGVRVQADNVNLSNFTVEAPTAAGSYGIKVEPLANVLPIDPNNRLRNFSIANVTSQGSGKTELDLNGVLGATIDHFTANGAPVGNPTGSTAGNGIALTDTANVVITNSVTENNQWGGLALYQTNNTYNQQTDNITVDGTNTFNEANPIYAEDQSVSQGFGALHLTGFDYVVKSPTNPNDVYTWFQRTQQNAIDFAAAVAPTTGAVEGYAGDSVNGNNTFYVGYNTANTQALSINAAVNAAASGATINVADGTYNQNVTINKANLTLQSDDGRDATTIVGQGNTALGTILVQANNFTLGGTDHGFTVVGIDNASPGIESAAVYIQGNNSGSTIQNNRITANGDEALLTEYSGTVTGLTVDNNIFDGQTFAGANPAGVGSSQQFTLANVPRQLVVISGGSGGGNTSNITFTNNQITGTTGGLNTSGQEQGNNLVTIDSHGATITGNTFAGKTDAWYDALRARGTDTTVTGNTFDGTNMGAGTNMLEINNSALVGSFTNLIANNVWNNGSAWVNHAIAGVNYVFRGIQNAITGATAGDTVNVGAGTYKEQVVVTGKNLDIEGAGAGNSIIESPDLLGHSFTGNGNPYKAIVSIEDGSSVTLSGFTIDGRGQGNANNRFLGVGIHNANATLDGLDITGVRNGGVSGTLDGVQAGTGVEAFNDDNVARTVTLENSTIADFQKNGAAFLGGDLTVNIDHNTITGAGNTTAIAQNGVEFFGLGGGTVTGSITNNTISGFSYGNSSTVASSILLSGASGTTVQGNTVTGTGGTGGYGLDADVSDNLTISDNDFSNLEEGVVLYSGNGINITGGSISGSTVAGLDADPSVTGLSVSGVSFSNNALQFLGSSNDAASIFANNAFDRAVTVVDGANIYSLIQDGINASSAGDTVEVASGTYNEALDISHAIDIEGAGVGRTIIQPTTLLSTGVGHKYDSNVQTAVYVHDTSGVTLNGLTIDANNLGANAVVFWNNASGTISNSLIENAQVFNGAQTGQALAVDATAGNSSDLTVSGVTFQNWNKNAIDAVTGDGSTSSTAGGTINLNVDHSTFTGAGPTNAIAQNGIVLWERGGGTVNGTIDSSSFTGLDYTAASSPDDYSVGVLAYGSPNGTTSVSNSSFSGVQAYISTAGGSTNEIDATQGNTFDGVTVSSATPLDDIFTIENKIIDGTDDTSNGLVRLVAGQVYATASKNNIQNAADVASNGDTVNVQDGSYTLAGEFDITKSLTLKGQSEGGVDITSNSTGYGINVTADNVSLQNFTYHGPTGTGSTYGIKVTPDTGVASDRLLNFDIENVTIDQGYRTGLDLNGVDGATIKNVSVSNIVHGNGIALTDSANVAITGSTTSNNAWGGLALYQTNAFYDQQLNNIVVDGSNSFNDTIPVYSEDQSASLDIGSVTLAGFDYVVQSPNHTNDVYSWFQKTQQAALDFATNGALSNNNVNVPTATVQGYSGSGVNGNNVFYVGTGTNSVAMSIAAANAAASNGATIDVLAGTYTLPGTLVIDKSLSLVGAGEGATNIDGSAATNYAMRMRADDISLSDFTLSGPGGISVYSQTLTGVVHNASISNVTIDTLTSSVGVSITQADGVALDHVTVDGTNSGGGGNGVQIVDSANVALTNVHTVGNQGGLVIVENGGPIQTNNISADTTNNFQDPVIIADFSAGAPGLGSVNVQGFQYAIGNSNLYGSGPGRLSNDQQNTIDTAVALGATDSFIEGWTGTGVNNTFTVGTSTGGTALSVNTAIGAASTGGIINVNTGTYAEDVTDATQLTFNFGDVNVNSFTLASGGASSSLNGNLTATGAIALNGSSTVAGNLTAASFSSNATLAMTGNIKATGAATFNGASTITGNVTADSITDSNTLALAGNLAATHGISLGGASAIVGNLSGGSIATTAPLTLIGNATASGAVSFGGTTGVTGNVQGATIATTGPLTLVGNATASGGVTFGGVTSVTGNVKGSAITANNTLALNGSATASGAITANGAALLSGNLTGGSIALNGATTLTGNTTLDTSAANGAISTASVDGTTAGGQSLGINAGTGTVSLGDLGAATRLGAVSDASNTTLTGSTYNANSFLFGGDVTLTSADTTLNTTQSASAAGDITFQGDLFGTTDAAQSLTLIAGPGTGAASANGNITLQNAGTSAVYLNDLTVSGNDFTALTVDVGGDYNALLTGNQVFAADTLNVRGNASSIVGGDASGHIVAGGDVTIAAGGDISGTISGQNVNLTGDDVNSVVTATNAANIKGNTVEGSYTANTVTLIASNNVDAAVDATDFTLAANHGSVDGNWVTINTDGSNVVSVNGQTTVGLANVNPNQLVVEGFVLPAGTRIGANGQLILPQGVLLGLLSPGGGKPKMILVHSVQQLGELLAGGYSVIVIDLSNRDSGKPIQLASN